MCLENTKGREEKGREESGEGGIGDVEGTERERGIGGNQKEKDKKQSLKKVIF